jgi:hypothetical protein
MSENTTIAEYEYKHLKEKWSMWQFRHSSATLDDCTTDVLVKMRGHAIMARIPLDEVNLMANRAIDNWIAGGDRFGYFLDARTVKNLQAIYEEFGDAIDKAKYELLAKSCVKKMLESDREGGYIFRAIHALDHVSIPTEDFNELNLRIVKRAFQDTKSIQADDGGCFFDGLFKYSRNRDDLLAKLAYDRKVQQNFRSWADERFQYYDEGGGFEHSAVIGSLGGLDFSVWSSNARRNIVQILRREGFEGSGHGFGWARYTLEYIKGFIECTDYPKRDLVQLAEKEIKLYDEAEAKQFISWLREEEK